MLPKNVFSNFIVNIFILKLNFCNMSVLLKYFKFKINICVFECKCYKCKAKIKSILIPHGKYFRKKYIKKLSVIIKNADGADILYFPRIM